MSYSSKNKDLFPQFNKGDIAILGESACWQHELPWETQSSSFFARTTCVLCNTHYVYLFDFLDTFVSLAVQEYSFQKTLMIKIYSSHKNAQIWKANRELVLDQIFVVSISGKVAKVWEFCRQQYMSENRRGMKRQNKVLIRQHRPPARKVSQNISNKSALR